MYVQYTCFSLLFVLFDFLTYSMGYIASSDCKELGESCMC